MYKYGHIQTWDLINDGKIQSAAYRIERTMSEALLPRFLYLVFLIQIIPEYFISVSRYFFQSILPMSVFMCIMVASVYSLYFSLLYKMENSLNFSF